MSISSEIIRNDYISNGVLDTYPFEFIIYSQDDINMYADGVIQIVDIDFTIASTDIGKTGGGNIVFGVGHIPANLSEIAILSGAPYVQGTEFSSRDETYEETYDKAVILIKQLKEMLGRALKFSPYSTTKDITWPEPMAGYYFRWNDAASGIENISHPTDRFTLPDVNVVIVSGDITVTDGPAHYIVDTQGGAASDDLDRVVGLLAGEVFTISALSDARTVVIKAGTYFKTLGGLDYTLSDSKHEITFRMGANNIASEMSRSSNA